MPKARSVTYNEIEIRAVKRLRWVAHVSHENRCPACETFHRKDCQFYSILAHVIEKAAPQLWESAASGA